MVGEYDLVVIGAGPAGESAAQMAANLGYSVALVERDTVGGTVVTNCGAPTKTFREAALYLSGFEKEKVYGVSLAALPEVIYPAMTARARAVSAALQQATSDRLQALGVRLVYGDARLEDGHTVLARSAAGGEVRLRGERGPRATYWVRPWPRWPSIRDDVLSAGRSTWTSPSTWIRFRSALSTGCPRSRAQE
jgi:NAD(P) transhydrogenase